MHILKIATININGIIATTRVGMLCDFVKKQELDIIFLQEVTNPNTLNLRGYNTHYNIGTSMRGTAIAVRDVITLTGIHKLPSGRAMSADYNALRLINVYAPSGSARRTERENFYNTELPALLYSAHSNTILGGDFNCVLNPADTTGTFQTSRALTDIVSRLALVDTWKQDPRRPTYTHHHPNGATRIDRLYVSKDILQRKSGIEILPAAFTDHHVVALRVTMQEHITIKRRRRWKMDPIMIQEESLKRTIRDKWTQWPRRKRHYPEMATWWERCVKNIIQRLVRAEERERHRNFHHMENHLHECLYDIIRSHLTEKDKFMELQRYKAKLVRLHATRREQHMLDTNTQDKMEDEEPSLFHLLKTLRRRNTRAIHQVQDSDGNLATRPHAVADVFRNYLSEIRQD